MRLSVNLLFMHFLSSVRPSVRPSVYMLKSVVAYFESIKCERALPSPCEGRKEISAHAGTIKSRVYGFSLLQSPLPGCCLCFCVRTYV